MKFPKISFRKKSGTDEPKKETSSSSGAGMATAQSTSGGKEWLILNVEKILLVVALGFLGFLIYSGIGKFSVNAKQTPEQLAKLADTMDEKIEQSGNEDPEPIPDFVAGVERSLRPISTETYSFEALTGLEARQLRKRTRPEFLPLEQVWGNGGSGVFWVLSEDAEQINAQQNKEEDKPDRLARKQKSLPGVIAPKGSRGELKHWAVITAILPFKEQQDVYERHFEEAEGYDALKDVPKYLLARIQRIEVPVGKENFTPDWEKPDMEWEWGIKNEKNSPKEDVPAVDGPAAATAMGRTWDIKISDKWAGEAKELVDAQYVHGDLTTPLGPLGHASWRPWAKHPDIPLSRTRVATNAEKPQRKNIGKSNRTPSNSRQQNQAAKKQSLRDRFRNKPLDATVTTSTAVTAKSNTNEDAPQRVDIDKKLVRLFDFDVEPGKTYLYRVQLLLVNPNYDKPSRILKNPRDRKWQLTPDAWLEWSVQSNPVRIPEATTVHAASVQVSADEALPQATVIVKKLTDEQGRLQLGKRTLKQGGNIRGSLEDVLTSDGRGKPTKGDETIATDFVLVDIRSPHAAAQQDTDFSELLFLDDNGQFFVRDTASDQQQTALFQKMDEDYQRTIKQNKEDKGAGDRGDEDPENPEDPQDRFGNPEKK